MNYHTLVTTSATEAVAEQGMLVPLTAARLSSLRHDMRTPFNQIIGYAEMTGEDGEDAGAEAVTEKAAELATAAHDLLGKIAADLTGDPEQITPGTLKNLRLESAPAVDKISQLAVDLRAAVKAVSSLETETAENVDKIESALDMLRSRLASTTTWHTATETMEPIQSAVAVAMPTQPAPIVRESVSSAARGTILIVDDHVENRDLLRQRLDREGFQTVVAENGLDALALLGQQPVDLVLLDVMMPGMDGIEVLQRIKGSDTLKSIPVIMISALDEIERVVQCIETGAEDYLTKPFNPVLLRARIGVTLERKRLRDEEEHQRMEMQQMFEALAKERKNAHDLLLNILPEKVANDLQQGHSAPMYFEDCTICFTDFVGFTLSTENMAAELVVEELHTFFTAFDMVMERYGLEKLKTIGDSYMFASGLPKRHPGNPVNALLSALELIHETERLAQRPGAPGWKLRIGLHTGPVIAGVVGIRKFAFDIWGDSVNFASRMESSGAANCINVSERTYARIKDFFVCEHRGKVMTKDKREVDMYFVRGVQPELIKDGTFSAFAKRYRLYFSEEPPSFPEFLLAQPS